MLRHAQAETGLGMSDADRPLTARGRDDAAAVGRELTAIGADVDLVLCSTARRARETWSGVSGFLAAEPAVEHAARIYGADDAELLDALHEVAAREGAAGGSGETSGPVPGGPGGPGGGAVGTVLLVGHNPAVFELVMTLTGEPDVRTGFPAGAFAVIRVPTGWADLAPGTGRLATLWRPSR